MLGRPFHQPISKPLIFPIFPQPFVFSDKLFCYYPFSLKLSGLPLPSLPASQHSILPASQLPSFQAFRLPSFPAFMPPSLLIHSFYYFRFRNGNDKLSTPVTDEGILFYDFIFNVPRQDEYIIGFGLADLFGRKYRDPSPW